MGQLVARTKATGNGTRYLRTTFLMTFLGCKVSLLGVGNAAAYSLVHGCNIFNEEGKMLLSHAAGSCLFYSLLLF